MLDLGQDVLDSADQHLRLVGVDLLRSGVLSEDAVEEPLGCHAVAAGGEEDVDHLAVLIDGPVHVAPDAGDTDVGFSTNQRPPTTPVVTRAMNDSGRMSAVPNDRTTTMKLAPSFDVGCLMVRRWIQAGRLPHAETSVGEVSRNERSSSRSM